MWFISGFRKWSAYSDNLAVGPPHPDIISLPGTLCVFSAIDIVLVFEWNCQIEGICGLCNRYYSSSFLCKDVSDSRCSCERLSCSRVVLWFVFVLMSRSTSEMYSKRFMLSGIGLV